MTDQKTAKEKADKPAEQDLTNVEMRAGHALAAIHRLLAKLDQAASASEVQAGFKRAVDCLESARQAHLSYIESKQPIAAAAHAGVAGETVAVITAAIAAIFGRSYRLLSVQKIPAPAPHFNVWALEGRTQIFQSHKVR